MSLDLRAKECTPSGDELVLWPSCQEVVGDDLEEAVDESFLGVQWRKRGGGELGVDDGGGEDFVLDGDSDRHG